MFGMSSEDFWENDPQLYWAYRTFYIKKLEYEQKSKVEYIKYDSWLKGNLNFTAHVLALNNAFSKEKKPFPTIQEFFGENEKQSEEEKEKNNTKTKLEKQNDINLKVQQEFNSWARF